MSSSTSIHDNSESTNSTASNLAGNDSQNLFGVIDRDNVHGLNLSVPEDAKEIIKPWDARDDNSKFAESGVDDQLIIHIPFTQNVRVKSLLLKLGRGEVTPRHLRIYANHPTIVDFAEAENTKPQLNISLLEGETGVVEYPLRVAAFTSVHSLSLFFNDAVGEELSRIYYIGFRGDMRSVKRDVNSLLEVPAPNAADAPLVDKVTEKAAGQQTTAR
ncbi:galactose-binding domain-like protein [Crucibulum laeve]|uniref:Galactose-binding domain-like protein n=1 Tax=Crucibulum laeve TaxID=68775 RepID=A0A5C3LYS7_9AGAR|nr:galactose-binding domain-like protein [Crucibulum laeve]